MINLKSIIVRLCFVIAIAFTSLIALTSFLTHRTLTHTISQNQDKLFLERKRSLHAMIQRKYEKLIQTGAPELYMYDFQQQVLQEIESVFIQEQNQPFFLILNDSEGNQILPGKEPLDIQPLCCSGNNHLLGKCSFQVGKVKYHAYCETFAPWGWQMIFVISEETQYRDRTNFFSFFIPIILSVSALFIVIVILLLRHSLHPILILSKATKEIASGNLEVDIEVGGVGEIGELQTSFKIMRESIVNTIHDIQHSEFLFRESLDMFPVPIAISSVSGEIQFLNNAFLSIFGQPNSNAQTVESWLSEVSSGIIHNEGQLSLWKERINESILTGKTSLPTQFQILVKTNLTRLVEISMQPIGLRLIHVFNDITEQHLSELNTNKLKEQLHQSQKMEALGQLAGGVAHDFNNLLGGIIGAAELLSEKNVDDFTKKRYIENILNASDRAAALVKQLLTFSRKAKRETVCFDFVTILHEMISMLEHTLNKNITLCFDNRAERAFIEGDPSLLHNAFLNIAINSSHAMPNGGELSFALSNKLLDAKDCAESTFPIVPGEYLKIVVHDTGIGMDEQVLSKIFDPFFTTKKNGEGLGLGMSTVYGTIVEHFGAILVNSKPNKGTEITVYLPLSNRVSKNEVVDEDVVKSHSAGGTVLVIEDETVIRFTMETILKTNGYQVLLAVNGAEGVLCYEQFKDKIGLVLLDMIMPVMGGRETFFKLREIDPEIPVIVASGYSNEGDLEALDKEGINGHILKPFKKNDLLKLVEKHIRKQNK